MFILVICELLISNFVKFLAVNLFFLLANYNNQLVLLSYLLQVLLNLFVNFDCRKLIQLVFELFKLDWVFLVPREIGAWQQADDGLGHTDSFIKLSLQLVLQTSLLKQDFEISLGFQLIDLLPNDLISVLHIEMLLLNLTKVISKDFRILVVKINNDIAICEALSVYLNNLFDLLVNVFRLEDIVLNLKIQSQILIWF